MRVSRAIFVGLLASALAGCAPKQPIATASFHATPLTQAAPALTLKSDIADAAFSPVLELRDSVESEGECGDCVQACGKCDVQILAPPPAPFDPTCTQPVTHADHLTCALMDMREQAPEPWWFDSLATIFAALIGAMVVLWALHEEGRRDKARDKGERLLRLLTVEAMAKELLRQCGEMRTQLISAPTRRASWVSLIAVWRMYFETMAGFIDNLDTRGLSSAHFFGALGLARMKCQLAINEFNELERRNRRRTVRDEVQMHARTLKGLYGALDMIEAAMSELERETNKLYKTLAAEV